MPRGRPAPGATPRPDDGIAACSTIIESGTERGTNLAIAHFNRANGWLAKGELDRAVADLSGAIGLDRTNAKAFYNRGNAWMALGAHERAVATSPRRSGSMRISPPPTEAAASRTISEAISSAPSSTSMPRSGLRRRTRARSPRGRSPGAPSSEFVALARDFDRAVEIDPNDARLRNERGATLQAAGQPDRALADFTEAIRLDGKFARARANRGLVQLVRNNLDAAIADLDEALRLAPADVDALINRGTALQLKGDLERARADYDAALRIAPDTAAALERARQRLSGARRL